ncbi:DUF1403 family protein [Neorhizobium vignae]|uniref:DUF1403 family protein n=1 Tax=Neorhizobium vignae TaxID=690585 RepID=UPI0031378D6A
MIGRAEEKSAVRDAVLLTASADDPGPAGKLFSGHQNYDAPTRADQHVVCQRDCGAFCPSVGR